MEKEYNDDLISEFDNEKIDNQTEAADTENITADNAEAETHDEAVGSDDTAVQEENTSQIGGIKTTYVSDASEMPRTQPTYSYTSESNPNINKDTNVYAGRPFTPSAEPNGATLHTDSVKEGTAPKKAKKAKKRSGKVIAAVIACSLIFSAVFSFGGIALILKTAEIDDGELKLWGMTINKDDSDKKNPSINTGDEKYSAHYYANLEPDGSVTTAVEIAANSVVEITTETVTTNFFYGEYVQSGAGSGVIVDSENGYIVTCAHVISGASTITVTLRNGDTHTATVIGSDAQTDIAVIRIETEEELIAATPADSEKLVVGQTAIAIGNPLGTLGGSVSSGIVSALDREITIDGQEYSLMQIDTSINPGNSGGGLFDVAGNLIGIVNAKSSSNGASTNIEGLGFAIPINQALAVAEDLVEQGYVGGRVYLGINVVEVGESTTTVDPSLYDYIYAGGYGVYFVEYQAGQKGDFLFGDKIIAVDGNEVSTRNEILSILGDYSVGDTVIVSVSRLNSDMGRRKIVDVEVTLIENVPTEK